MKDRKLFITSIIFFVLYIVFIIGIFSPLKSVFMPFVTAAAFVYFLSPLVNYLKKLKVPPFISVGLIYLIIISIVVFSVFFAIPTIYEAIEKVWGIFNTFFSGANIDTKSVFSKGAEKAYTTVMGLIKAGTVFFVGAVSAFYILTGTEELKRNIKELVPFELKPTIKLLIDDVKASLDSFFKGQIVIAFILFLIDTVFLYAMGIPYALGLGAIAAVLDVVPYVGAIVGCGIILAITLISNPGKVIIVFVGLIIIQQIENNIISPKISSDTLSLHPSVTILVLYIGAFGGFWGILLAVPLTSIFCKICQRFIQSIV